MQPFVITSILAPTDLSESSIPALRYARLFADRFVAKLTVMYTDPVVYPVDFVGSAEPFFVAATREHEAHLRDELAAHANPVLEERPYEMHVSVGQPVASILAAARDLHADFIVTGTHLRHGWRRALLGSVSEGVLHGSDCPVLTVASRDGHAGATPRAIANIVCPVNLTEVARVSLHAAARVAETFGAQLTVVHVLEPNEVMNPAADEERVRRWVEPEVQERCSYRSLVMRGGAAERVLDCADDLGADLLIVGAQHKLFRDATVVGTTTERLIRFASCPVLVVPRAAVRRRAHAEAEAEQLAGAHA